MNIGYDRLRNPDAELASFIEPSVDSSSSCLKEEDPDHMMAKRQCVAGTSSQLADNRFVEDHHDGWSMELDSGIERCNAWLLGQQRADGHWVGELEGDTILESEYVLLMAFLGREREDRCLRLCHYMLKQQRPDGGWSIYPGGPFELSASVKAYFALKLTGFPTSHPAMTKAKAAILAAGGAQNCNSFTRFYLALLAQIPYEHCPCVPPELTLLPKKLGFSLCAMSSWTRTIVVPLSIISAYKPKRDLPTERGIGELFRDDLPREPAHSHQGICWENFFLGVDRTLKGLDRWLPQSWRKRGIKASHRWMIDHFENSDGLGAIFPPMIYSVVALDCLGYDRDHEYFRWALKQLDDLFLEDERGLRIQPCVSPIWDTAISIIALLDAGLSNEHSAIRQSVRWLLDREVRQPGDWMDRRPGIEPTGWHFQYQNGHYPDIDDTAMVLIALERSASSHDPETQAAVTRAVNWLLAMQNRDGGWAAFDVDIDNEILTKVPFADHNAILDPSCADITARILEILGALGYRAEHPAIARALDYLWSTQEQEGCWYGRWGVNYIYGTWQVLLGLRAIEFPLDHPRVRKAADWLESVQQSSGGWGESCDSYEDSLLKAVGLETASQSAWAVLGLIAAGRERSHSVQRGVEYLLQTQNEDGSWDETEFTGTGFPKVFYLRYHFYRIYFPLMALGRYRQATTAGTTLHKRAVLPINSFGNGHLHVNTGPVASRVPAQPLPGEI